MTYYEEEEQNDGGQKVFTLFSFMLAVTSLPFFCCSYIITTASRYILLRCLKTVYPNLEFINTVSIRSAMDTAKNTGFIVVLLKVNGQCDLNLIKNAIQSNIIDKRDRLTGRLCFPHLTCCLTRKWLRYAWSSDKNFSINNHVVSTPEDVIVTEENILEYINDIVKTHIPSKQPQWQITVVPIEDSFYLLVRMHHLYASEDGVGISDLLLLKSNDWKYTEKSPAHQNDVDSIQNILSTVYQAPTALPRLYEHVSEIWTNTWNELVSTYDPLENPKILKHRPNAFVFSAMVAIVMMSAYKDTGYSYYPNSVRKELVKRNIRWHYALESIVYTFHPALWISFTWWLMVKGLFRFPITVLLMFRNTYTYVYWTYVLMYSASEMLYIFRLVYNAPRTVIQELVFPFFSREQRVEFSLSGKKCVYWSGPIDMAVVNTIHNNTGAATCEIQLSMLSAALQEYFDKANVKYPKNVMTTTRFVSKNNLFQLNDRRVVSYGLLSLPLPMDIDSEPIYCLHKMQECLQEAIANQTGLYIASMWQIDHSLATSFLPSPFVSYGLSYLSKKYPLTVTYVEENKWDNEKRRLLWDQEVEAILYWRPPQANVCLSLSMMNYGGNLRLAIMADAKMAPLCQEIVSKYENNVQAFVLAAEEYAKIVNTSD
ncbi:uncharacterized protein LOC126903692 [Daktulosphaira vitifoliae]|uniref:uncharacterized protein LOC126903692 n=1 Tax=Daktulosphaira vitifoliae TaxID=58002 RepID=UPI0021AA0EAA|nr:uncharacterized protein LOC126903692 [Daktulosphaira vitifoliae]